MHTKRTFLTGIAALMLVNVIDALKEVYFGIILRELDSTITTFVIFIIAWPVFFILYKLKPLPIYQSRQKNHQTTRALPLLLTLNLSSAALWITFIFSLKFLEPAIVSALIGGIGIVTTLALSKLVRPATTLITADYVSTIAIAAASIYLAWISIAGRTALTGNLETPNIAYGYLAIIICGIAMAITSIASKTLADNGVPSRFIYANRFYLLLIITGTYALSNPTELITTLKHFAPLLWLSVLGVILPLFILQEGIKRCEPVTTQAILAAAPLFTILFQAFDSTLEFSMFSLAGVTTVCLAAGYNGLSHLNTIKSRN